ncbi:hypothetical protein RvY_14727-1 [Ramazzottius varieornatus]|uniref:Uncharacterized protein n=1 Tax=Ramazzottius varieornatus TaxID=947166 RepID=A0A1D1VSC6_RAMVA|nr:hypothetical protein RvY_14727-1 [Ramazzottius varieornatus]
MTHPTPKDTNWRSIRSGAIHPSSARRRPEQQWVQSRIPLMGHTHRPTTPTLRPPVVRLTSSPASPTVSWTLPARHSPASSALLRAAPKLARASVGKSLPKSTATSSPCGSRTMQLNSDIPVSPLLVLAATQ